MSPYLTATGRALLAAAVLFIAAGALASHWALLLVGAALLGTLAMSYYALMPAALALERRLLAVEISAPDPSGFGTLRAGHPVRLKMRLHNRAGVGLRNLTLDPHAASGLRLTEAVPDNLQLPGHATLETDLALKAAETGRWFLHGFKVSIKDLLGLVCVGEYVATPTCLKFMPDPLGSPASRAQPRRQKARDREGAHLVRQAGFGTDLRELREHQSGDPFRAIAWKATARTGRLMVKDYESELVTSTYLCLDISSTMRGGQDPARISSKLEHALRLSAALSDQVAHANDRLGLITFDEKIHGHLRPRDGKHHQRQLLNHLVGVRHVVDEDLTEYSDLEVAELVARYLLIHERLDFRRHALTRRETIRAAGAPSEGASATRDLIEFEGDAYDFDLLQTWIRSVLDDEARRFDDLCLHAGVLAYKRLSPLRRFCHLRGVEIPYRVETRLGQKERGLVQCLEEILSQTRESHTILILSDLCGIMNTELIVRALRLVQARRHKIAFIAPFTPDYVALTPTRSAQRSETLHALFTLAEQDERRAIVRTIEGLGIPVLQIGPEAQLPEISRKLSGLMRRRR